MKNPMDLAVAEARRRVEESLADPQKVTVTVLGRNGHAVDYVVVCPRGGHLDFGFETLTNGITPDWRYKLAGQPAPIGDDPTYRFSVERRSRAVHGSQQ